MAEEHFEIPVIPGMQGLDVARMDILDPTTGEPMRDAHGKAWWVDVWSAESDAARAVSTVIDKERQKLRGRDPSVAQLRHWGMTRIVGHIKEWYIAVGTAKGVPCTEETCRAMLKAYPWLLRQVSDFLSEDLNFLGESKPSSD
jgi:hypothetical protein